MISFRMRFEDISARSAQRAGLVRHLSRTRNQAALAAMALITAFAVRTAASMETAEYEVTFDATWCAQTHPQDFPRGSHFSGLIGGTHHADVSFWGLGELASAGIERMAETGGKSPMDAEIQSAITAGDAFSLISGGGIGSSPGSVSDTFTVSSSHSQVTLVSMIAPSPDWFVGVSGLDLRENDRWLDQFTVDLIPYDAGTDSGSTFTSRDADTNPPEPISEITEFPFMDAPPLGTFAFRRLLPELRAGDADEDLDFDQFDVIQVQIAAKYSTGQPATWGEGDWNGAPGGMPGGPPSGDGVFDSLDIVAALQGGTYRTGPYALRHSNGAVIVNDVPVVADTSVNTRDSTFGRLRPSGDVQAIVDALYQVDGNDRIPVDIVRDTVPTDYAIVPIPEPSAFLLALFASVMAILLCRRSAF